MIFKIISSLVVSCCLFSFLSSIWAKQSQNEQTRFIYVFGELSFHLCSLLRLKWRFLYYQDIQVRDGRQVQQIGLCCLLFNVPLGTRTCETDDIAHHFWPTVLGFTTVSGSLVLWRYEVNLMLSKWVQSVIRCRQPVDGWMPCRWALRSALLRLERLEFLEVWRGRSQLWSLSLGQVQALCRTLPKLEVCHCKKIA